MKVKKWIEENVAILESSKQWLYRKCANHIAFFKSYVTFSKIHRLTFIQRKFIHNFPASVCD
jgi:hypothetical protein